MNNREDGVKIEDCVKTGDAEIIDNVHNRYNGDKCRDLYFYKWIIRRRLESDKFW